jgi:hypothetical protein
MSEREDPWPACPKCDGDGYTETWNDDQSDVVITLCSCQIAAEGIENSWTEVSP